MSHSHWIILVKAHKLANIFDWYYEDCIHFFLEKHIIVLYSILRSVKQIMLKQFSDSCFVKVPILSFLVIHFVARKCFLFFFPSQDVLPHGFCYFQISFNNLLPNKQTNKQMKTDGKNNSCVTMEWKIFCLNCDAKDRKHYTFSLKIYKA